MVDKCSSKSNIKRFLKHTVERFCDFYLKNVEKSLANPRVRRIVKIDGCVPLSAFLRLRRSPDRSSENGEGEKRTFIALSNITRYRIRSKKYKAVQPIASVSHTLTAAKKSRQKMLPSFALFNRRIRQNSSSI